MKALHIKQWNDLYERADTRKVDFMPWYPKQSKLTGLGIGFTLAQVDNVELLGLWTLIETICCWSKKHHRGWLVRNGVPLTAEMMSALVPAVPAAKFQRAIDHFQRPEVNWLELAEWQDSPELPGLTPPSAATSGAPGKAPDVIPPSATNSAATSGAPGKAPTGEHTNGESRERGGKKSATDRQTDRQTDSTQTDRQTDKSNKKDSLRLRESGPSLAEVAASKTQYAANVARRDELKATPRDKWTEPMREEWQKIRATLKNLGEKQRAGSFV